MNYDENGNEVLNENIFNFLETLLKSDHTK